MYNGNDNINYDMLMNTADKALYVTKKFGRFGYTVFSEKNMERKSINNVSSTE